MLSWPLAATRVLGRGATLGWPASLLPFAARRTTSDYSGGSREAIWGPQSSKGPPISPREAALQKQEEEWRQNFWEIMHRGSPQPKLRGPTPPPPQTHLDTWANRAYVSENVEENALQFTSRFYIDSTGKQPPFANKVEMRVNIKLLGLSELEEKRFRAVALPYFRDWKKTSAKKTKKTNNILYLTSRRHSEVGRNKAELRQTLVQLIADARENAEAHALIPDSELPLKLRSRPWFPKDRRLIRNRPRRKLNKGSPG